MVELNKFYIGESASWMKENLEDCSIDLTITSPPYDNLRKYKGYNFNFEEIAKELYRVTKNGGVVVWVVGDATIKGSETGTSFRQALYFKEIGFNLHDTMIYGKNGSLPLNSNRYEPIFEYMFVFSKGKPKSLNKLMEPCKNAGKITTGTFRGIDGGMKHKTGLGRPIKDTKVKGNIWFYDVGNYKTTKDAVALSHPAIFPEQLANDHIISWSNPEDIVFDCMCGSGTVCKMAYLNDRKFIGVDISEEYINEVCVPRLKMCGWENDGY